MLLTLPRATTATRCCTSRTGTSRAPGCGCGSCAGTGRVRCTSWGRRSGSSRPTRRRSRTRRCTWTAGTTSRCAIFAGRTLTKTRTLRTWRGLTLAVDVFAGELEGLVLAEVDLGEAAELPVTSLLPSPDEVTEDERFTGAALASTSREQLHSALRDRSAGEGLGGTPSRMRRRTAPVVPSRVMDLFCGTGGFSKGFEDTGQYRVVYGIDILKTSVATFALNHDKALAVLGDIRAVHRRDVTDRLELFADDIDVMIGGPPCQGFSSIRPQRSTNYDDTRNSLFAEFAAYLGFWRPRALVFENVVGLATHRNGDDLVAVQEAFARVGYETDWRVVNAANFGVPQKRERLIMIGVLPGFSIRWPEPTHSGQFRTIGIRIGAGCSGPTTEHCGVARAHSRPP